MWSILIKPGVFARWFLLGLLLLLFWFGCVSGSSEIHGWSWYHISSFFIDVLLGLGVSFFVASVFHFF